MRSLVSSNQLIFNGNPKLSEFSNKTLRFQLVVALFAVARGNPQFVYTVGQHRYPYVFTNGHSASYSTPSQPLSYVRPQLYANNACRNHLGELVPCALPSVAGQSVYAYNAVPNTGFVQAAAGVAAIPSQVPDEMPPAPEAPAAPVKAKREAEADADASPEANAEADPYYYPGAFGAYHPYYYGGYAYGYPYSKYGFRYFGKRSAEAEPEANYGYGYGYPYGLGYPSNKNNYGRGYGKRSAEAEPEANYGAYGYGHPYGHPYGHTYGHTYGKRSAEAEPEAKADADPAVFFGHNYAGYYGSYLPYYYGAYHANPYYHHAAVGCRNSLGALVPCAGK